MSGGKGGRGAGAVGGRRGLIWRLSRPKGTMGAVEDDLQRRLSGLRSEVGDGLHWCVEHLNPKVTSCNTTA